MKLWCWFIWFVTTCVVTLCSQVFCPAFPFFCLLAFFLALLTGQLKSVTGDRVREGEWCAAGGPGLGLEPGSAAGPRHMSRCTLPTQLGGAPVFLVINPQQTRPPRVRLDCFVCLFCNIVLVSFPLFRPFARALWKLLYEFIKFIIIIAAVVIMCVTNNNNKWAKKMQQADDKEGLGNDMLLGLIKIIGMTNIWWKMTHWVYKLVWCCFKCSLL